MENGFRIGGSHYVEPSLNSIAGPTGSIRLEPKVMQVLVCLAAHAGDAVPKERLMRAVWPDTFVGEDVLTRAISELRRAFGDDAREPRFIQTIAKGGYRLIAEVSSSSVPVLAEPGQDAAKASVPTVAQPTRHRKDPERRFQHVADVKIALQEVKEESESGVAPAPATVRHHRGLWAAALGGVLLLIAVGAAWLLRPSGTVESPPIRVVPLTTFSGSEFGPTFSPDGEQVAFSWNGEGEDNFDIYLKLIGSSEVRRLTTDPADDFAASWSPDGRLIAFLRRGPRGAVAYVVSPVTGTERKVAELGQAGGLSWSHDGRWLATSRFFSPSQQDSGIYLVPTEGGEVQPFMRGTPPAWFRDAAFSPDGRQLAYVSCAAVLRCQLQVATVDDDAKPAGPARPLTKQAGSLRGTAWSQDGRSVFFSVEPVPFTTYLWRVQADGSQPPERIELAGMGAAGPTISRARDRLAFVRTRNSLTLHPLDSTFTSAAVLASSFWDFDARFSPDGRQLAFSSSRSGETVEIWIARADGSGARQVTRGPGRWQGSPTWSPDGRQIAFDSQGEDGHWAVWVIDADGGVPHRVTREPGDQNKPTWSRDGQWVYFTAGGAAPVDSGAKVSVKRVRISGGASEQIALTPEIT